jgi:cob(I)alamin adenosyltransferase
MMVKIYTRKGDDGSTGLFDGTRVGKDDERVDAYGDVDELNAVIGAARAFLNDKGIDAILLDIQSDLFAVGAQLADPKYATRAKAKDKTKISEERISAFERIMDGYENELPPLKGFILPCGAKGASFLHVARTVCRRAERKIVALGRKVPLDPLVVKYMNRLSDLLFVLARVENLRGGERQIPW